MLKPLEIRRDSTAAFDLVQDMGVPQSELHAFLCDLHRYVPLHPLIESIEDLPGTAALPAARVYRVVDRIALGPFRIRTVYTAALEPISEDEVHGHAWQSPAIRLHTVYALSKSDRGTRLVESCYVDASSLMRGFVVSQAKKAHTKTLEEMKSLLENRDAP